MIIQKLDSKALEDAEREFLNCFGSEQENQDVKLADWARHWGPVLIEFAQGAMEEKEYALGDTWDLE